MSGIHVQMLGRLLKRSADFVMKAPVHNAQHDAHVKQLETQAELYENSNVTDAPMLEVLTIFFTCVFFLLAYASIKYTVGEVVASLAMIEQPRKTIITATKPTYTAEADASLEKDRLIDEDVIVLKEKPLTTSIAGTVRHLSTVGGYRARWRGLVIATVYHFLQAMLAHILSMVFGLLPGVNFFAFVFGSVISTVLLARIHMTWTHIMISHPSPLPWYKRVPHGRTYYKALFTPALIFALAQHLTIFLPVMTYLTFGHVETGDMGADLLRLGASLATMIFVALALLLPATVTLTRVEASLLPDDTETIVPFDRTLGGAAANLVGFGKINFRALYDAAWRSFDKTSRIRLIKFYVKYFAIMASLCVAFVVILGTEVALFGATRMLLFVKSGSAQIQLASLQATGN